MKPDKISFAAKTDPLICLYGESYLSKHKRKQMINVASNRIRELARLKLALQKFTTIKDTIDMLKPEMYENIIAASKIICGFDNEKKTFKASSLALHLGTNLKFLCDVAKKVLMTKHPLFNIKDVEEKNKKLNEISNLKDIIMSHWCNDLSSLASKALNERSLEKPKLVPLTEDIKCLNDYIGALASEAFKKLKSKENIIKNYKTLAECTLCLVLVFNRKRIGEVQFLHIDTYKKDESTLNHEEFLKCLTEFEKNMSSCFKRVVVFGKGSKPVAILFTKRMQSYIELLLNIREETDIVSKANKYVFANPGSSDRWMCGSNVIRKYAYQCGAKKPELLTSTKFRKQIATILQLINFECDEMEQIARFMGHTEKTHREFYRLTENAYQTAKVAKVLILLNEGKGDQFKGKSLNQIELEQDGTDIFSGSNHSEKDTCNSNETIGSCCAADTEYNTLKVTAEATKENDCSREKNIINSKIHGRCRWSQDDKKLVLKFFNKHIQKRKVPRKEECLNFIRQNNTFSESDWVRIKTLVYNSYRLKQ